MKRIVRLVMAVVVVAGMLPMYATDPINIPDTLKSLRKTADKFTVTTDQATSFVTTSQQLAGVIASLTPDQAKAFMITLQDARYGGTMPDKANDLDAVIALVKAGNPTGTGTGTTTVAAADASYLSRVKALSDTIAQFKFKQAAASDKTAIFTTMNGLVDDRGGAFAEERTQLSGIMQNSKLTVFRGDDQTKAQVDALIATLNSVSFTLRLTQLQKLYDRFTPFSSDDEKARCLRSFKELANDISTATVDESNNFKNLIDFAKITFFDGDATSQATLDGLTAKIPVLDASLNKPYADILAGLQTEAPTVSTTVLANYMQRLDKVVSMRYGNRAEDAGAKAGNKTKLQALLASFATYPVFDSVKSQIVLYTSAVNSDTDAAVSSAIPFGQTLDALYAQNLVLGTSDANARASYMLMLDAAMNARYGNLPADLDSAKLAENKSRTERLLRWLRSIPWFVDQAPKLDQYIAAVVSGATGSATAAPGTTTTTGGTTTTTAATFSVVFDDDAKRQLTLLNASFTVVVNNVQQELFILSLYNLALRKDYMMTVDVNAMRQLVDQLRTTNKFPSTMFASTINDLVYGLSNAFSDQTKLSISLASLARIGDLTTLQADDQGTALQGQFVRLLDNVMLIKGQMSDQQRAAFMNVLKIAQWRGNFNADTAAKAKDYYAQMGGTDADRSAATTTPSTTPPATTTTTPPATTTPPTSGTTADQQAFQAAEQQRQQAQALQDARRAFLRSRMR